MGTFNVMNRIRVGEQCANIDAFYGPYNSVEEACTRVTARRRALGRTVGIIENGKVVEYWWDSGTTDQDLVLKVENLTLSLSVVGNSVIDKGEGELISFRFLIEGRNGIQKALLYQVMGSTEVLIQELSNVGKGSPNTVVVSNPSVAGIYTYRIKVLDATGSYAEGPNGSSYIEYTLNYGGISAVYTLTQLDIVKIKNYSSVADKYFNLLLSVRDEEIFEIEGVKFGISTKDPTYGSVQAISLTPYKDQGITPDNSYLGSHYYYLPDSATLRDFDNKECSIFVFYTENGQSLYKEEPLFKLLGVGSLELVPVSEGNDYYAELPSYYIFQLKAGVENISVYLTEGENSDFSFTSATVSAYSNYSLLITPHNTIKNNALIVINYSFNYLNEIYSGSFTRVIGNILAAPEQAYYEPEEGNAIKLDKLIDCGTGEHVTVNTPIVGTYHASSFIIDMYCKINQQNDSSLKFLTVTYGGTELINITEDAISGPGVHSGLTTDTPLNEWTQIGIGVNLEELIVHSDTNSNEGNTTIDAKYHGIYINGMIVKNVINTNPVAYSPYSELVITVGDGILVNKCYVYRREGANSILPKVSAQGESIIYNNFRSHNYTYTEPSDLPVLKLMKITDREENTYYFNLINAYKQAHGGDKIVHTTTFGTIGATKADSMGDYDTDTSSDIEHPNAMLLRQSVNIKKPAQKEYAAICRALWSGGNLPNDVIVEVHTQGTSTLMYSIPNFKFTFWHINNQNEFEPYYPEFIKQEGTNNYYREYIYTAKADYMDSSHLNNTPTCNYYNNVIQSLISLNVITGSPSARNGKLDAILGFPIVLEVSDVAGYFDNIGSFMLNIDKTGDSLGFEVTENGNALSCISFEGTSNDNLSGASGRFTIPDGVQLKNYVVNGVVDEAAIQADYDIAVANLNRGLNELVDGVRVCDLPYVKWCSFLSDGLEYRYPDSDMYKEKSGSLSKVMNVNHFKALYKMWSWVSTSDTLSKTQYREEFPQHFDVYYCMLYFIQLMVYALTDNLGKNAMFDSWDGEIWYPRPYDLDSEAGLDNGGNDNIATFVEIKSDFSLNYDSTYNLYELASNYLIDHPIYIDEFNEILGTNYTLEQVKTYQSSGTGIAEPNDILVNLKNDNLLSLDNVKIIDASTLNGLDRYHFSSNTSKLWINFYNNYRDDIRTFYRLLKNNVGYSALSIINFCESLLINKLGTAQYNKDFINKYLGNADQRFAYGNRWYKFKKWITKRFAFCDSYFGAYQTASYGATTVFNYNIKVDSPQYITHQYQQSLDTRFVVDTVAFNGKGDTAATIMTLNANQGSILDTSLFKYVYYLNGDAAYTNLINLDVSGNTSQNLSDITLATGQSLDNLKYLNISNSSVNTLTVPPNVKTLVAENVTLNNLVFPQGCAVETISLKGSTLSGVVGFSSLPNLTRLDLTNCTFKGTTIFAALPVLSNLIMTGAKFEDTITISEGVNVTYFNFSGLTLKSISFSGTNLGIDTLNFYKTNFTYNTLNLNAVSANLHNLYLDSCTGLTYLQLTDNHRLTSLQQLSFSNSPVIALGSNNSIFDCSCLPNNISSLKKVSSYNNDGTAKSTAAFTFENTRIATIANINWDGTGLNLFADCQSLVSIGGTLTLRTSIRKLFYRCYALTTLPTINIAASVLDASYAFAGVLSVSYLAMLNVISNCTNATTFDSTFQCTKFSASETINLDVLFGNNSVVTDLTEMFTSYYEGNFRSVSNSLSITGKIPPTVTTVSGMFREVSSVTVPYDLLSISSSLTSASYMFASANVTFTGNNLPTQTDAHGVSMTLNNAIDHNFFSSGITTVRCMFYSSNVITNDDELFQNMSNLSDCTSTFGGGNSVKGYTFTNSEGETEVIKLDVVNMWANNPNLTTIAGCFANIYSVYCTGLNFHQSLDSSKTIDISGLFGLANKTYRDFAPLTLDIDSIAPRILTDRKYAVPSNGSYNGVGVFQNRCLFVPNAPVNHRLFGKLNSQSRRVFYGTVLYIPDSVTTFDISNVPSSCAEMFAYSRVYIQSASSEYTYTENDRKFVTVILPSANCSDCYRMFYNSSVLSELPAIQASNTSDVRYMFSGCIVKQEGLTLPSNYFESCAESLTYTDYMFLNNQYLVSLEYNASRGLFQGCTNLLSVTGMFQNARFLHGGIPVNFFGTVDLPRLTSLASMFHTTSILYDVADESNKWVNTNTFAPLVKLDTIDNMFYLVLINSSVNEFSSSYGTMRSAVKDIYNADVPIISGSSFINASLSSLKGFFKFCPANIPFGFKRFSVGTEAFFDSGVSEIAADFVNSTYVSSIINVDRMFYRNRTGHIPSGSTVTNLSTFISRIQNYSNISKANIAGNLTDENIPEVYKRNITSADEDVSSGFGLQRETSPEIYPEDRSGENYYRRWL